MWCALHIFEALTHLLQRVASVQQVLNVLRHDLCHVLELIVESAKVVGRARILVCSLRLLKEAVELGVCVWAELRVEVVVALVGGLELVADVFEVGDGQLLRIAAFGDCEVCDVVSKDVAATVLVGHYRSASYGE